jgi:ABC-2 type transport system permease protein
MTAIIRKELADYFTSLRCFILFLLVILASAGALYAAYYGIREAAIGGTDFVFLKLFTTSGKDVPSLITFIALFVPIVGIAFGFDAINREYSSGTMSRVLAQPVFRDSVINGKFLAGTITLAIIIAATLLIVSGYGLRMIGVPPTAEEIIRLFLYFLVTTIYGAFWTSLAVLFSVLFRSTAISLLSSLAVWLFFSFFYANLIIPATAKTVESLLMLMRLSPSTLYQEATTVLLIPQWRGLGILTVQETGGMLLSNPLSLGQSLLVIWPQFTALISLSIICFAISYVVFMRQEIRAT